MSIGRGEKKGGEVNRGGRGEGRVKTIERKERY